MELQKTKHVHAHKSNSTDKMIVKMSRVSYGHVEGSKFIQSRKATESVQHSLNEFCAKNSLIIESA